MTRNAKLMEMLTGYAAAHEHPVNVAVHLIGIPTIMLGLYIVFSWINFTIGDVTINGAHVATLILFIFYLTLDTTFSIAFLAYAMPVAWLATRIGEMPMATAGTIAATAFFGGYVAQFVGHAVEKSAPVILKHPIQANLAAPFFIVVEMFSILNLRNDLFNDVKARIAELRQKEAT